MKKLVLGFLCFVLVCSFVLAQQGIHDAGTGIDDPELKEAGQGTGQGLEDGQVKQGVGSGNFVNAAGNQMGIQKMENNRYRIEVAGVAADCPFNLSQVESQNRTRLYARLSNGQDSEIVVMPDMASQTALERLRLRNCTGNCTLELKEVAQGTQTRLAYELSTQRTARVFGLFSTQIQVQAQVDAENGEVLQVNKPWWAFISRESEE